MKKFKRYIWAALIIILSFALDRLTKEIIRANIELYDHIEIIKDFFYITHVTNTGGAWSMLSGKMTFFYIITCIALLVFGYLLIDFDLKKKPFYSLGVALMTGGCIGNFYDRILFGKVVDFLDFYIFGYDFPVFNVADICMVVGAIAIILHLLLDFIKTSKANKELAIATENEDVIITEEIEDKNEDNSTTEEKEDKEINDTSN